VRLVVDCGDVDLKKVVDVDRRDDEEEVELGLRLVVLVDLDDDDNSEVVLERAVDIPNVVETVARELLVRVGLGRLEDNELVLELDVKLLVGAEGGRL
jgi:hypothetical protein